MNRRRLLCTCAGLLALLANSRQALAVVYTWSTPTGGSFSDSSKWSPVGTPIVGDRAFFNPSAGGYTVTFPSTATTSYLFFNDTATFDLSGNQLTLDTRTSISGDLTIKNGTLNGKNFWMEANVQVKVVEGGHVVSPSAVVVGMSVSGSATLSIDGADTSLFSNDLVVAEAGVGNFYLKNGAQAIVEDRFEIGGGGAPGPIGLASIDGPTTVFTHAGNTGLSVEAGGTLKIQNGADLTETKATAVSSIRGTGTRPAYVYVEGANSTWTNQSTIFVGKAPTVALFGPGTLTVSDGALVSAPLIDVYHVLNVLSATVEGNVHNLNTVANNGLIDGNLHGFTGSTLSGNGTVTGDVTIDAGAAIAPGNSVGQLNMDDLGFAGTYQLEMNSAGGAAGGPLGWDFLDADGAITISGFTKLELRSLKLDGSAGDVADFNPFQDYQWTIAKAPGGIHFADSSSFLLIDASKFTNTLDPNRYFDLAYTADSIILTYAVPEPGAVVMLILGLGCLIGFARRRADRMRAASRGH